MTPDHGQLRDKNLGNEFMGLTDIIVEWFQHTPQLWLFLKRYLYVPQLTTTMHMYNQNVK